MNKKQPELQRFIRLLIVLCKCETTDGFYIQTICIVLNATVSFIYHCFLRFFACTFFSWCSPTANRFHPFHFSNDLVTEHRMCFHIRSTVQPLSASDRIDWYVYVCSRSSMQEEFSIKKNVKIFRRHSAWSIGRVTWSIGRNVWKMGSNFIGSLSN